MKLIKTTVWYGEDVKDNRFKFIRNTESEWLFKDNVDQRLFTVEELKAITRVLESLNKERNEGS